MQLPLTQAEPLSERRGKRFFYVVGALVAIVMVQAYLEFATTDSRWKISQLFREVSSNVPTQQHGKHFNVLVNASVNSSVLFY